MKKLLIALILLATALPASALNCTQQQIILPNGKLVICTTCCYPTGYCYTSCI